MTCAASDAAQLENDRWAAVFHNGVRELNFFSRKPDEYKFPLRLLQAPKLRFVTIPSHPTVVRALANCKSLRTLRVDVLHEDLDDLWCTLSTLEIRRLTFRCGYMEEDKCPLLAIRYFSATRNVLQEVCPGVKSLSVDCFHCVLCDAPDNNGVHDALGHMYKSLP